LVEVKTGRNALKAPQVEAYLDIAMEHGFDAVITISNEIVSPGAQVVDVDRRKLRRVSLHHLSWSQIRTEAQIERDNKAVSDPEQAWILSEFIGYLEHEKSGAADFEDMGPSWVAVRDLAEKAALRAADTGALDVVARFDQLIACTGMLLSRKLAVDVKPALTRKELVEPAARLQAQVDQLALSGQMAARLKVPDTVAPLTVTADIRARRVHCSVTVDAPATGRPLTRVNWLLRQLQDAPADLRIEAIASRARGGGPSHSYAQAVDQPTLLLDGPRPDIRAFTLTLSGVAGNKRGMGKGSFVASVRDLVDGFYAQVVQNLKPWAPRPPQVKAAPDPDDSVPPDGAVGTTSTETVRSGALRIPDESDVIRQGATTSRPVPDWQSAPRVTRPGQGAWEPKEGPP
jgi:hypothetical protein